MGSSSNPKQANNNNNNNHQKHTHMGKFGGNKVQRTKLHLFCVGDGGDRSRESKALVMMSEIATSGGELAGCSTV